MTFRLGKAAPAFLPLCAALVSPLKAEPPAPDPCRLTLTARFVGALAVSEVRRAVQEIAHPHPLRWITPGQAIAIDQNLQRLNVILDETGRIASMRCG